MRIKQELQSEQKVLKMQIKLRIKIPMKRALKCD